MHPDFVSVTYGAGGSNQDRTVRVMQKLLQDNGLVSTPINNTIVRVNERDFRTGGDDPG